MALKTCSPCFAGLCLLLAWAPPLPGQQVNQLTTAERAAGFRLLFDGKSFNGWKQQGNWTIVEQALYRGRSGGGLTCVAQQIPDDFELRFQWKVARGSNVINTTGGRFCDGAFGRKYCCVTCSAPDEPEPASVLTTPVATTTTRSL